MDDEKQNKMQVWERYLLAIAIATVGVIGLNGSIQIGEGISSVLLFVAAFMMYEILFFLIAIGITWAVLNAFAGVSLTTILIFYFLFKSNKS